MFTAEENCAAVLEVTSVVGIAQSSSNFSGAARQADGLTRGGTEHRATYIAAQGPGMNRPRVLLADNHRILSEGLRSLLEPHFEVVGIVTDGRDLVAAVQSYQPDVVVLEISMLHLDGIDALRQLKTAGSCAKVIFLTMHREVAHAARALEAGASGYLLKSSPPSELVTAIEESLSGRTYVTPQVASELVSSPTHEAPGGVAGPSELTPRQRQVLTLVAQGRSAKEIAAILHISRRTAEFHKARLIKTLGVHNTVELIQYAIRSGLIRV
jgi:DNA-binding NarL/FixJ family response regulator